MNLKKNERTPLIEPSSPNNSMRKPTLPDPGNHNDRYQWNIFKAVLVSATSSVLSGYDQGVIAAAMLTMGPDLRLSMAEEEVSIGILNLAAAIGGVLAGPMADRLGRRLSLAVANFLFLLGSAALAACQGFALLMGGRVIMGVGVGVALVVAPLYTAELVPPKRRGGLVALCDVSTNAGILLGYGSGLALFGVTEGWRAMFLLGALPAALLMACLPAVPESPRWLVSRSQVEAARGVLTQLSPTAEHAEEQLEQIITAQEQDADDSNWKDVFFPQDSITRRMLFTGLGVAFFSQATGTEAAVYYTPTILKSAGFHDDKSILLATMGVGTCKVAALIVATLFFDRSGRKPMLLLSAAGLVVAYLIEATSALFFAPTADGPSAVGTGLSVGGLCLYMSAFSLGFSPLTYVVCTEVFPSNVRAKAMSVALFITRALAGAVSMSFETLVFTLTPAGVWLSFAVVSCGAMAFVATYLPETKGLSLEEVRSVFAAHMDGRGLGHQGCPHLGSSRHTRLAAPSQRSRRGPTSSEDWGDDLAAEKNPIHSVESAGAVGGASGGHSPTSGLV